jgi:hypothetical protein
LGELSGWEIGVGGSDDFFEGANVLFSVNFIASPDVDLCFGLLVDVTVDDDENCWLLLDTPWFCVDDVTVKYDISRRTRELVVGELNWKFWEFPCCEFVKEKREGFDDAFVNENGGTDPDADGCDENEPPNGDPVLF